jgi:hypothetical protein
MTGWIEGLMDKLMTHQFMSVVCMNGQTNKQNSTQTICPPASIEEEGRIEGFGGWMDGMEWMGWKE